MELCKQHASMVSTQHSDIVLRFESREFMRDATTAETQFKRCVWPNFWGERKVKILIGQGPPWTCSLRIKFHPRSGLVHGDAANHTSTYTAASLHSDVCCASSYLNSVRLCPGTTASRGATQLREQEDKMDVLDFRKLPRCLHIAQSEEYCFSHIAELIKARTSPDLTTENEYLYCRPPHIFANDVLVDRVVTAASMHPPTSQ